MSEPTGTPEPQYTWQQVEPVAPVVKDHRRERRRLSIVVGGAAAFVLVALVSAVALSAPSGAPPALAAGAANPTPTPQAAAPGQLGTRSQACQDMLSNLAARLNISVQTLQQALTGAAGDTIDQLVQQGRLTQTQADQLKSALSNAGSSPCAEGRFGFGVGPFGVGPFGVGALPFAGGPGHGAWHVDAAAVLNAAASALKLDTQSLLSSLRSGQDLKAIAQKQGVDYATVTSAIHDAVKTQLDALVTQGTMTSAQETTVLNAVDRQLANGHLAFGAGFRGMPGGIGGPGDFGGGPGMHGWYGGRGGAAPNTPVSPTPSPTPQAPSSQG